MITKLQLHNSDYGFRIVLIFLYLRIIFIDDSHSTERPCQADSLTFIDASRNPALRDNANKGDVSENKRIIT